jgi:predicted kinase
MTKDQLLTFLAGSDAPSFVMLSGPESSGKTTLAKALRARYGFKRLSYDRMAKRDPSLIISGQLHNEFYRRLKRYIKGGTLKGSWLDKVWQKLTASGRNRNDKTPASNGLAKRIDKQFFFEGGCNVVDDNLNLTREDRLATLNFVRGLGVTNICIVEMDAPLETCLAWNKTKKVPRDTAELERHWLQYQNDLPQTDEALVLHVRPAEDADGLYEVWQAE